MNTPIAVIGISFELPKIKTWSDLIGSLKNKETFGRELSANRLQDIKDRFGPIAIAKGGYLDHTDLFDNEFFGLTKREALKMFPEHRYFLLHALRAFYDAGYTKEDLKGSNTGIFFSNGGSSYPHFLDEELDDVEQTPGIEGTRLASFLDIRGPVFLINTTCSSSLAALHNACLSLQSSETEMALTGGVRFSTATKFTQKKTVVMSDSEQCKPFDAEADGIINGEGVICMVLKRLEDAERDNDPIYGIIEGSAVNHGGARISSLMAPSAEAQKEVILKAWDYAKINPGEIKFIEAHGTGTILGDPIEFKAIADAFKERGVNETCSISSFKGQIGHLDTMSGMAGLLRLLAGLNSGILPVQPNFDSINEHIDERNSNVKIQREFKPWPAVNNVRKGGVSSFGLTGTNVHLVVSSKEASSVVKEEESPKFLQISAPTEEQLKQKKKVITAFIKENETINIAGITEKINRLYNADKYSEGIIFSDGNELTNALQKTNTMEKAAAFLLMDLENLTYELPFIRMLLNENGILKETWNRSIGAQYAAEQISDKTVLSVLFQYVLYKYIVSLLGNKVQVIARKGEGILQDLLDNKVQPETIIKDPGRIRINENAFNIKNFKDYLLEKHAQQKVVIIDFSTESLNVDQKNIVTISGTFATEERFRFYQELVTLNKEPLKTPNVSILLPDLQFPMFQLDRFWPKDVRQLEVGNHLLVGSQPAAPQNKPVQPVSLDEVRESVKAEWKKILEIEEDIAPTADFFELGGDSISSLDMLSGLDKKYGAVHIQYEEMFGFSTLEKLSQTLFTRLTKSNKVEETKTEILVEDEQTRIARYNNLVNTIKNAPPAAKAKFKDVLVTGATGFLGSYIIKRLIDTTDSTIICLVRGESEQDANDRLWNVFKTDFNITKHPRIKVIWGDLLQPVIFKSKDATDLLKNVNVIYHVAGTAAFVGNPNLEEHINYKGTRHIFDWAVANKVAYFNHTSTVGVIGSSMPKHIRVFYETDLKVGQETVNFVHSGTKVLAEEYLNKHKSPGINVNIFRIFNIGGRYADGFSKFDMYKNLMYIKFRMLHEIGHYSESFLNFNAHLAILPVDVLANCICDVSFYEHNILNTFHLTDFKAFLVGEIMEAFNRNGIFLKKVGEEEFKNMFEKWQQAPSGFRTSLLIKYGTFNKPNKDENYTVATEASNLIMSNAGTSLKFDRMEYLDNVVRFCIKEGFLNPELALQEN